MKRILYITSTEEYLVDKKIFEFKKEMNIEDDNDLRYLKAKTIDDLNNFFDTFSFFEEDKLALVEGIENEEFITIIDAIPDNVTLLIKGTLDKRKKVYKYLKKNKYILDIKSLSKKDLCNWIVEECNLLNVSISSSLAMRILSLTGEVDMYNIYNQLVKLAYMRVPVTEELIDKVVTKSLLINAFDLTNAILHQDVNESLKIINDLISNSQEMIPLLALINKNFCIIKSLNEVNEEELKDIGVNTFVIKNLRDYKKVFSNEELEKYIELIQKLDYDLKNGYDPKMVMENLILNI